MDLLSGKNLPSSTSSNSENSNFQKVLKELLSSAATIPNNESSSSNVASQVSTSLFEESLTLQNNTPTPTTLNTQSTISSLSLNSPSTNSSSTILESSSLLLNLLSTLLTVNSQNNVSPNTSATGLSNSENNIGNLLNYLQKTMNQFLNLLSDIQTLPMSQIQATLEQMTHLQGSSASITTFLNNLQSDLKNISKQTTQTPKQIMGNVTFQQVVFQAILIQGVEQSNNTQSSTSKTFSTSSTMVFSGMISVESLDFGVLLNQTNGSTPVNKGMTGSASTLLQSTNPNLLSNSGKNLGDLIQLLAQSNVSQAILEIAVQTWNASAQMNSMTNKDSSIPNSLSISSASSINVNENSKSLVREILNSTQGSNLKTNELSSNSTVITPSSVQNPTQEQLASSFKTILTELTSLSQKMADQTLTASEALQQLRPIIETLSHLGIQLNNSITPANLMSEVQTITELVKNSINSINMTNSVNTNLKSSTLPLNQENKTTISLTASDPSSTPNLKSSTLPLNQGNNSTISLTASDPPSTPNLKSSTLPLNQESNSTLAMSVPTPSSTTNLKPSMEVQNLSENTSNTGLETVYPLNVSKLVANSGSDKLSSNNQELSLTTGITLNESTLGVAPKTTSSTSNTPTNLLNQNTNKVIEPSPVAENGKLVSSGAKTILGSGHITPNMAESAASLTAGSTAVLGNNESLGTLNPAILSTMIINQISTQVSSQLQQLHVQSQINFQLIPENLGKVAVQLVLVDQTVSANIVVTNADVRDLLQHHLVELNSALIQSGLQISNLQVHVQTGSSNLLGQYYQYQQESTKNKKLSTLLSGGGIISMTSEVAGIVYDQGAVNILA
jgi:flagellar hook-length control protein FliK